MIDVVLGIIAFASLTTLAIEIALAVIMFRTAMRAKARVERIVEMSRGVRKHADVIAAEFATTRTLAERQIERAEEAYAAVMAPLEPLLMAVGVARSAAEILRGLKPRRSTQRSDDTSY